MKERDLHPALALNALQNVRCNRCNAGPGYPCRNEEGQRLRQPHQSRLTEAVRRYKWKEDA